MKKWEGFEVLSQYAGQRTKEFKLITEERKVQLNRLAKAVRLDLDLECSADLVFICTHNSRRSHMGQVWALLAAYYYEIIGIRCFSGGTEATAFNPRAVNALEMTGLEIEQLDDGSNPEYMLSFPGEEEGFRAFSKKYEDPPNPTKDFIAVMTCSAADEACPVVTGASSRHSITYEDPKDYDGTPEEEVKYDERSRQIAREMFYLFSRV
ncbi:MAG: protein-tyrosine-phosphatase [Bacteroidota bacterium]